MIETGRLVPREYAPDDSDALCEILSDPGTMAHYPAPFDEKQHGFLCLRHHAGRMGTAAASGQNMINLGGKR